MRLSSLLASVLCLLVGASPSLPGEAPAASRGVRPGPSLLISPPAAMIVQQKKGEEAEDESRNWYVYRDTDSAENHGHWTNFMEGQLVTDFSLAERIDPFEGESCVRIKVKFQQPGWCGIAVSCKPEYWGKEASDTAYDLSKAQKLVFYARGDKGGEGIQVKVAIAGKERFGDSARVEGATRWIRLTKKWERYELPINQKVTDLSRTVIPFSIFADRAHNTDEEITVFLDRVHFVSRGGR